MRSSVMSKYHPLRTYSQFSVGRRQRLFLLLYKSSALKQIFSNRYKR
jgi:hypothetical protein